MGIGKSLKKFVKKAAPIVGMVAPFIPGIGPIAGAAIGALGQVAGGGGVKEALLGGLGGYAAGGFGQGVTKAGGWGNLLSKPGGIGNLLKAGWSGVKGTPLGQGIGGIFNKFTGGAQIAGGAPVSGAQQAGGWASPYKPTQTSYLDAASDAATGKFSGMPSSKYSDLAMDAATGKFSGMPSSAGEVLQQADEKSISDAMNLYQQDSAAQGQQPSEGGFMNWIKNNPNVAYGLLAGGAQFLENRANPEFEVSMGQGLDYDTGRGTAVNAPVLTADFANGGRTGYANGNEVDPEYEGWKTIYTKNPDLAMMSHPNAAEYLKRFEKEKVDTKARGGIIGLANGGEPTHEMDLRGGGFIPVGAYERADDVPARVSKNEFVMTADAVRAAGGGSINRGSQRMYDLMNSLEGAA